MRKIILLLTLVLMIPLLSSAFSTLGTFPKDTNITILQLCDDCSFNNITSLQYPNGSIQSLDVEMLKDGTEYRYGIGATSTTQLGKYFVNGFGDEGGTDSVWAYSFEVTYSGKTLTTSASILYIAMLGIVIFIFLITFIGIGFLPKSNTQDQEGKIMQISYLKYLRSALWFFEWMLFIAILYLSSNIAFAYLGDELFAEFIFTLFKITFGLTPLIVIVWILWFFVKIYHDKQFQKLINRGFFPQGRLA